MNGLVQQQKPASFAKRAANTLLALGRVFLLLAVIVYSFLDAFVVWIASGFRMTQHQHAEWDMRICRLVLRAFGVTYSCEGTPPVEGIIVSNHQSYLDIAVIAATTPCCFVSKKEVKSWPVFGQMAQLSGTIFIDRNRSTKVQTVGREIETALEAHATIGFFPEGTSSDGSTLLRFRAALFAPAVATQSPITPAAIRYSAANGNVATDVCYWGDMTLLPHFYKLITLHGVHAEVRYGDSFVGGDARDAADKAWAIVDAMRSAQQASFEIRSAGLLKAFRSLRM